MASPFDWGDLRNDLSRALIRKIAPDGTITTVAGNGTSGYSGDGGPATAAQIYGDASLVVDNAGKLYFTDTYNLLITAGRTPKEMAVQQFWPNCSVR